MTIMKIFNFLVLLSWICFSYVETEGHFINNCSPLKNIVTDYKSHDNNCGWTVEIPKSARVTLKHVGDNEKMSMLYANRVYTPDYYDVNMNADELLAMQCGVVDFQVVIDYCRGGHDVCDRHEKSDGHATFYLTYELSFFIDNGLVYFSTKIIGDVRTVNLPGTRLVDYENGCKHFGPFCWIAGLKNEYLDDCVIAADTLNGTIPKIKLIDEGAFKEWILYETVSNENVKDMIWGHKNNNDEGNLSNNVQLSRDSAVSLGRFECIDLNGKYNFSFGIVLANKNGCVRVYDDFKCTGSSRIVVQEHVRLYSENKSKHPMQQLHWDRIKSIAGCWRSVNGTENYRSQCRKFKPYQSSVKTRRGGRRKRHDPNGPATGRETCFRSCPTKDINSITSENNSKFDGELRNLTISDMATTFSNQLAGYNATITDAMATIKESLVVMITATMPVDRVRAVSRIVSAAKIVANTSGRVVSLLRERVPSLELNGYPVKIIDDTARSTTEKVEKLAAALPETMTDLTLEMSLCAWTLQAFVWMACDTSQEQEKTKEKNLATPIGRH